MVPRAQFEYFSARPAKSSLLQFLQNNGLKPHQEVSGRAQGVSTNMSSTKQGIRLMGAFAALATLALAISCKGFFVNPTLTGVSVGPQGLTINVNETWQMTATGTYDDASQKNLTPGVAGSSPFQTPVTFAQSPGP